MASKKKATEAPTSLSLTYSLAELPSSQHRAGLAGLVLLARWLARFPERKGLFSVRELTAAHATLDIDQQGLCEVFDEVYGASSEETRQNKMLKKKDKTVEPLRTEEVEETDPKTGKTKKKNYYIYPIVVPRGGPLVHWDKTAVNDKSPWLKLWRDFIWQIPRGNPQSRAPFEERAEKMKPKDASETWQSLCDPQGSVKLPSTYFLGAQEKTAEDVPFRDRARNQFLLHFWPFVVGLYVPQKIDPQDGKRDFLGYSVAIPDVAELDTFCDDFPTTWAQRSPQLNGYRPAGAVIDLALESALDMAALLRARIAIQEGERATRDLVFGFDVFHMNKEVNNVRMLSTGRLEPDQPMIDHYRNLKGRLQDPIFRRQRLVNLLKKRAWFCGFEQLFATLPHKSQGFGSQTFRHDARESFEMETSSMDQEDKKMTDIIYKMAQSYVLARVDQKAGLSWDKVKDGSDAQKKAYNDAREKIARDAFLAVRSRTGADFLDYFAGTLASVQRHLSATDFVDFTRWLRAHPDDARVLTLLALSAVGLSTPRNLDHEQEEPVCHRPHQRRPQLQLPRRKRGKSHHLAEDHPGRGRVHRHQPRIDAQRAARDHRHPRSQQQPPSPP